MRNLLGVRFRLSKALALYVAEEMFLRLLPERSQMDEVYWKNVSWIGVNFAVSKSITLQLMYSLHFDPAVESDAASQTIFQFLRLAVFWSVDLSQVN